MISSSKPLKNARINNIQSLITLGQSALQIDLPYFIKGGFWLTTNQGVSIIFSFILSIAYARFLPKETYGQYTFIFSLIGFAYIFTLPGLDSAIIQAVANKQSGFLKTAILSSLKTSVFGSILLMFISVYKLWQGQIVLAHNIFIAAIFLGILSIVDYSYSYFFGKGFFRKIVLLNFVSSFFSAGAILLSILLWKNLYSLVAASIIGNIAVKGIVLLFLVFKDPKSKKNAGLPFLKFGKQLTLASLPVYLTIYFDKILLGTQTGFEHLAIYSFAVLIPEQGKSFLKNIASLGLPKMAKDNQSVLIKKFAEKMALFSLFTLCGVFVFWILAPFLFKYLFPNYTQALFPSQLFSISIFFSGPSLLLSYFFESRKDINSINISNFSSTFLLIALDLLLIRPYGVRGAIWAKIFSRFFTLIIQLLLFYRIFNKQKLKGV